MHDRARRLHRLAGMTSKAELDDLPIHPLLVSIPIVLFVATLVFEVAHLQTGNAFFYRAAMFANIVGVVSAVFVVIPGATGVKHSVLNSITVSLFAASAVLLVRSYGTGELYVHLPLAFGMLGIVALTYAGALYALPNRLLAALPSRRIATRTLEPAVHN